MREAILMLSLMVVVMLVVHFKMVTKANQASSMSMIAPLPSMAEHREAEGADGVADATR